MHRVRFVEDCIMKVKVVFCLLMSLQCFPLFSQNIIYANLKGLMTHVGDTEMTNIKIIVGPSANKYFSILRKDYSFLQQMLKKKNP